VRQPIMFEKIFPICVQVIIFLLQLCLQNTSFVYLLVQESSLIRPPFANETSCSKDC